jgi:DUF971 family protein
MLIKDTWPNKFAQQKQRGVITISWGRGKLNDQDDSGVNGYRYLSTKAWKHDEEMREI